MQGIELLTVHTNSSVARDPTHLPCAIRYGERRRQPSGLPSTMITRTVSLALRHAFAPGGVHRLDNGMLLRSDVQTMLDRGYLGVGPQYRLRVSPRLRDEFGNEEQFYAQAGQFIELPARRTDRLNREFLEWHLDEVFTAS
jgi:predicted restriction endonuclease